MSNRALVILVAAASIAVPQLAAAQNEQSTNASVVTQILHADSGSTLTLTSREVVFEFTPVGAERARRRADSTTAGYADRRLADLVRASVHGAFRDMRIRYSIADIATAESAGRTVMIRFKSARAGQNNPDENSFDFDAIDEHAAQDFALRLNRAAARKR
jgi:hypothetical protein